MPGRDTLGYWPRHLTATGTPCDPAHPNAAARQLCADIRRALFGSGSAIGAPINATLRYAGRSIDRREPGSTEVGVTVRLEAAFSYSLG